MGKGIFIIGTDTDAGKTFAAAGLAYALKQGQKDIIPYKPVQSGGYGDTKFLKEMANLDYSYEEMNTYTFEEAVSPHLASKIENIQINKEKIITYYKKLINSHDYVIVEGAGGIVVPLIDSDYYIYDLIKDLELEVVIVARAGVGTINHTVLTNEFLKLHDIKAKGIIINQYNDKFYEKDNIDQIKELTNLDIIHKFNKLDDLSIESVREEYSKINIDKILQLFEGSK